MAKGHYKNTNDKANKECAHDSEPVNETKGNHENGKGKAKPITSPQKPWISY